MMQSITHGKRPIITVARVVQREAGDPRVRLHAGRASKSCGCKRNYRSRNFTAPLRVVAWPPQYESNVSVFACIRAAYTTTFGLRNKLSDNVCGMDRSHCEPSDLDRADSLPKGSGRGSAEGTVRRGLCEPL